ncbi:hypothetical protein WA026_015655 [Henosepilachna vigintioctopunctata]|uniref:apyrase n=1 Tax=Henosepilachna vigintioctopunctata TaxID=420089 RepID=A0AAW1V7K0_9CUCU
MINSLIIVLCAFNLLSVHSVPSSVNSFELAIVHVNDFHARFEESNEWGGQCDKKEKCIGGFSRMYQTIETLKKNNPNILLLNAGDNFQGTVWYNIFKWNVTQHFLNKIPFDAYTLGNHEFDDNVDNAVQYMKHLKAPVVLANVNDSLESSFQGLYKKSIVVERGGKKIGLIGVLLTEVMVKARIGKLKFFDESESINAEAERLVKEHNVFTNIIISHCGYELEQDMAKKARGKISVIVGGHTHSLLWTGDNPPSHAEKPEGPYPTVVQNKAGKNILVLQAQSFARYVGNIRVQYNSVGEVTHWSGSPIFQTSSLPQNPKITAELMTWKESLDVEVDKKLGESLTELSNAMIFNGMSSGIPSEYATVSLVNSGALKESIQRGNITYRKILDASPFTNDIVVGHIRGKFLLEALEHALEYFAEWRSRLLQVSGLKVTYDFTKPEGKRVKYVQVRCFKCSVPKYSDLQPNANYNVVTLDFLTLGGDGFSMLRDNFVTTRIGSTLIDSLVQYVKKKSPVWSEIEGRITVIGDGHIKSNYR